MQATTSFDGGGGCTVSVDETSNEVTVTIEDDPGGTDGYFGFAIEDGVGETVDITIDNIGSSAFATGDTMVMWDDPNEWKFWTRTESFSSGTATVTIESSPQYFTADPPYPYQATVDRITQLETDYPNLVTSEVIGQSQQGRDMYAMRITDPDIPQEEKTDILLMTRQHAGEAAPSYNLDGMVDYFLDVLTTPGKSLNHVFHVIPHSNPDGMYHGWERHDASGVDLNREWDATDPQVEVANMRSYFSSAVTDYRMGIDLHSRNSTGEAVYCLLSYADAEEEQMVNDVADANVYASGVSDHETVGTSRWWFNDTYNELAFTSEIYQFEAYTVDELEVTEGQTWADIVTDEVDVVGIERLRWGGNWGAPS